MPRPTPPQKYTPFGGLGGDNKRLKVLPRLTLKASRFGIERLQGTSGSHLGCIRNIATGIEQGLVRVEHALRGNV